MNLLNKECGEKIIVFTDMIFFKVGKYEGDKYTINEWDSLARVLELDTEKEFDSIEEVYDYCLYKVVSIFSCQKDKLNEIIQKRCDRGI